MIKTIQKQVKFQIEDFDAISKKLIELEAVFIGGFLKKPYVMILTIIVYLIEEYLSGQKAVYVMYLR